MKNLLIAFGFLLCSACADSGFQLEKERIIIMPVTCNGQPVDNGKINIFKQDSVTLVTSFPVVGWYYSDNQYSANLFPGTYLFTIVDRDRRTVALANHRISAGDTVLVSACERE